MAGLVLQGVVFRGCQVLAFLGLSLISPVLRHSRAWCPGFPHLKHNFSLIRRWNSLLERLRFGRLLVASRSIGSPLCSIVLNVPSEFLCDSEDFIVAGNLPASVSIKFFLSSFLIAHCARPSISSISSSWCSQACRRSRVQLLMNIRCREWSSQFASVATNRNWLQWSVIGVFPCSILSSWFRAFCSALESPNCCFSLSLNCSQVVQSSVLLPSTYGVIHLDAAPRSNDLA